MANNFNILARVQLQGPNNVRQVARQIQSQLQGIRANVQVNIANGTNQRLNNLNANLGKIAVSLRNISTSAAHANRLLLDLSNTIQQLRNANRNINVHTRLNQTASAAANASGQMRQFGEQAALAVRRFAAFAVPTSIFLGLVAAVKEGVSASIEFEKEMVRLSQVTGKGLSALSGLSDEITRLSTSLGVSSKDLGNVATTLAQAGLSAKKTSVALEALARSSLAATFTSIEDTTEGAIAVFRQFNVEAEDLQGVIGSLNSVSAQFAVESDDLVSVIRRTGGAFKASGGNLNELLGLFTSVRATTRESADSIATGFRTIFTRIQRPRTIQYLKELGVQLQDAKGQFIGPLESIRRLNAALKDIPTTDPRFASVIEELGGFRQVSKVIPLIQQFPEALKAISVAEQGQNSIVEDSITAQKSLANQIAKVREEFLALFRELTSDKSFRFFVDTILDLAKGLIEVTRAIKPLIPLLGSIALIQGARSLSGLGQGFVSGLRGGQGRKFAEGGIVPGSGNGDTVPAMLTPGEFVVKKSAAKAIGFSKLAAMNKYKQGGSVRSKKLKDFEEKEDGSNIDERLSIAALLPTGKPPKTEFFNSSFKDKDGRKQDKTTKLTITSLDKKFGSKIENLMLKKVYSAASSGADILQKAIGATRSQPIGINSILVKSGLDSIIGNIFEGSLALAGAPYDDKKSATSPIDFPKGIGSLAKLFPGLKPDEPTDAKRTATSKDFSRRNLSSYFKEKYGLSDLKVSKGSKAVVDIPVKQQKTQSYIQSTYDLLDDEKKKKINSIASGSTKFSSSASLLKNLGLRYATKGQIEALKLRTFAEGGGVPGSGNSDSVPSLLTPGEFVINKRAAQRLGSNTLSKLNNADKPKKFARGGYVQRFARGGPVEGSNLTSGFEKVFLVTSLLGALTSSLGELDKETQKVVNSMTAVVTSTTALSFGLRSFANDRKLRSLSLDVGNNFGSARKNDVVTKTLARNFDVLAGAVGLASSAAVVFGQSLQDSALQAAKNASSQSDLNKAISQDRQGAGFAGAGVGAGIGAAIGTVIAPGIGTAIGAGIGALTGSIVGALNGNSKELKRAFNQAGFDKTTEKLGDLFDDFSSNRKSVGQSASGISAEAASALDIIKNTSDIEQRQTLTKELKGQIVNYRTLSSAIVQNVSDINQFRIAYGSSGQKLIESISFLTNKSIKDVEESIQNEIEARNISVRAIEQQSAANAQLKAFTVGIKTLSESFQSISDSVNAAQDSIDELIASTEGSFSNAKINSDIPNDFFSRVASGNVQNIGAVSAATNRLTATLDPDSQNEIVNQVTSVAKLTNELPNIIRNVAANTGLSGDTDSAERQFNAAIDGMQGVSDDIKSVVKNLFGSEVASRESTGDAGFKKTSREDLLGLADKLVPEALKNFVQELDNINRSTQNVFNTINDRMVKANQLQLNISKKRGEIEAKIFELSKFRLAENKDVQLSDVSNSVAKRRNFLIKGTGLRPNASATEAFSRLNLQVKERERQRELIQKSPAGSEGQNKAQIAFDKANNEVVRLTEYMKDLASSTEELTFLQDKLAKAEQDRGAGKDLIKGLLFGSGADRVKFSDTASNINAVRNGNKKLLDLPEDQRNSFFDLIDKLPQNKESKFLGGVKPQDFINKQIRESLIEQAKREGTDPQKAIDLADEFTQRSNEERETRAKIDKLMQDQITAETLLTSSLDKAAAAFDKFNLQSLEKLPQLLTNAIAGAQVKQLEELQRGTGDELATAKDKKSLAENLANRLGVSTDKLQGAGQRIEANSDLFIKLRSSKDKQTLFSTPNNEIKNKEIANTLKREDTSFARGGLGFRLTADQAKEIANRVVENDKALKGSGQSEQIVQDLITKLQKTVFGDSISGNIIKSDIEGGAGFEDTGFKTFNDAVKAALEENVNVIKSRLLETEKTKSKDAEDQLKVNLSGEFGANTKAIIEQFLDPAKLKAFSDGFAQVNVPFGELEQKTIVLGSQFDSLAQKIKFYNEQIKPVPPAAQAIQEASGGWIHGRSIGSPMTTYTPKGADRIPAILSRGEYVVNARAAAANAGLLESINAQGFARGGRVKITAEQYQAQQAAKRAAYQSKITAKAPLTEEEKYNADYGIGKLSKKQTEYREKQIALQNKRETDPKYQEAQKIKARNEAEYKAFQEKKRIQQGLIARGEQNGVFDVEAERKKGLRGEAAREYFARNPGAGLEGLSRREGGTTEISPAFISTGGRLIPAVRDKQDLVIRPGDYERKQALKRQGASLIGSGVQGLLGLPKRLRGFATGGPVPGSGNRDSVPALLTPGEFVLNRRAAKSLGLNSLANFNQKFANGGVVGPGGGGGGGMLNINPQALATLEKFYGTFTAAISQFGSSIGVFTQAGNSLASALSNWGGAASKLSEALSSMPHEIQVSHAPMNVVISVSGLETFRQEITNEVLAAMDQRMASQRTKAADGKSPFMSK